MLLALGGCCVGLGSNLALKRTAFSCRLPCTLALAHGGAYSTPVKNPVFVCASVSKVGFAFGFALGTFGFGLALVQAHFSGYAAGFE